MAHFLALFYAHALTPSPSLSPRLLCHKFATLKAHPLACPLAPARARGSNLCPDAFLRALPGHLRVSQRTAPGADVADCWQPPPGLPDCWGSGRGRGLGGQGARRGDEDARAGASSCGASVYG
eukprot:6182608-Pleurochrysis_carterae.AAC.1